MLLGEQIWQRISSLQAQQLLSPLTGVSALISASLVAEAPLNDGARVPSSSNVPSEFVASLLVSILLICEPLQASANGSNPPWLATLLSSFGWLSHAPRAP